MRRIGILALVAVLLAGGLHVAGAPPVDAAPVGTTCPTFDEPVGGVPDVANPFDPAQVDVQVRFLGPSGQSLAMPAFYAQDFERALVAGQEQLTPTSAGGWRVRFTPTEPGEWTAQVGVSVGGGDAVVVGAATFRCEADPTSHGFLRRSPDDPHQLRWDDGTPYLAVGENLGWYDARGTHAYDAWLDQLAGRGATWIRVWMPSWAFGLEWIRRDAGGAIIESSLGDYATRLDRAWQLDHVIEAARRRGIVVQLVLQNHGAFTTGANTEWVDNPYNAANGGPLTEPTEFFTDETAKELFARRMRYVVARWGHATNVVWEFWNEVDLTEAAPADVVAWHVEMGDRLRELDPYDHLQTTSVSGALLADAAAWMPLYELPQIDLTQLHFYGIGNEVPLDFTVFVPGAMSQLRALGKPALLAEAGVDYRGPVETLAADPDAQGFHELLWTGLFSGGYGSGMTWWWDNVVDPEDQYDTFDGLVALTTGVAFDREGFALDGVTVSSAGGASLGAYPLRGRTTTLVWVRNTANWWHQPDLTRVDDAVLTVEGIADGSWRVEWVDPYSATVLDSGEVTVTGSSITFDVPAFERETALRLTAVDVTATEVPPETAATPVAPQFTG